MKEVGCGETGCGCSGGSRLTSNGTLRPVDSRMEPRLLSRTASNEIDPRGFAISPYHQPPAFDPRKLLMGPIKTRSIEDTVRRGYPGLKGVDPSHLVVGGQRKTPFVVTATGRLEVPMQSDQGLVLASMILTLALQGPNPEELELVGLEGFGTLQFMSCAKDDCKGSLALRVDGGALSGSDSLWQKGDHLEIDVPAQIIWTTCRCAKRRETVSQPVQLNLQLDVPGHKPHVDGQLRSSGLLTSIRLNVHGHANTTVETFGNDDAPTPAQLRLQLERLTSPTRWVRSLGEVSSVVLRGVWGFGSRWRQMTLQPIFVVDRRIAAYQPDQTLFSSALVLAQQVWAKAGVDFYPLAPITVDLSDDRVRRELPDGIHIDYEASSDGALRAFRQVAGVHRVFLFRSLTSIRFGRTEPATGDPMAYIVTSMQNTDLEGIHRYHLAHELGHTLGIRHVDDPADVQAVTGSTGTVMCIISEQAVVGGNLVRSRNSLWHKLNVRNAPFILRLGPEAPPPDCCFGLHDMENCPPGGCVAVNCAGRPPCVAGCV